jgi:hypothetical protein
MEFCFILCVLILKSPDCEDRTTSVRGRSDSFPNSHVGSGNNVLVVWGQTFVAKKHFWALKSRNFIKSTCFYSVKVN